jgi:hypothetical protein
MECIFVVYVYIGKEKRRKRICQILWGEKIRIKDDERCDRSATSQVDNKISNRCCRVDEKRSNHRSHAVMTRKSCIKNIESVILLFHTTMRNSFASDSNTVFVKKNKSCYGISSILFQSILLIPRLFLISKIKIVIEKPNIWLISEIKTAVSNQLKIIVKKVFPIAIFEIESCIDCNIESVSSLENLEYYSDEFLFYTNVVSKLITIVYTYIYIYIYIYIL